MKVKTTGEVAYHPASALLTGDLFYDLDFILELKGVPHKVTAVHRPDTSTAHHWEAEGVEPGDILLSIRPCVVSENGARAVGGQRKLMVKPDHQLLAVALEV